MFSDIWACQISPKLSHISEQHVVKNAYQIFWPGFAHWVSWSFFGPLSQYVSAFFPVNLVCLVSTLLASRGHLYVIIIHVIVGGASPNFPTPKMSNIFSSLHEPCQNNFSRHSNRLRRKFSYSYQSSLMEVYISQWQKNIIEVSFC